MNGCQLWGFERTRELWGSLLGFVCGAASLGLSLAPWVLWGLIAYMVRGLQVSEPQWRRT